MALQVWLPLNGSIENRGLSDARASWLEEYDTAMISAGYQQLPYLESTGTQYINTGVIADSYDVDFQYTQGYTGNTVRSILGTRTSDNSIMFTVAHYGGNLLPSPPDASVGTQDTNRHRIQNGSYFNNKVIYDGTEVLSYTTYGYDTGYTVYLFGENREGSAYGRSKCKIFAVKLYLGGAIVRDFIPCFRISDNVAGMWDCVTQTFFSSSGGGSFAFTRPKSVNYGKIGMCYEFNGFNDGIKINGLGGMENWISHNFSIAFWIRSKDSGGRGVIFSQYGLNGGTNHWFSIEKGSGTAGTEEYLRISLSLNQDKICSECIIPDLQWTHIAVTKSSDKEVCVYQDGELVESYVLSSQATGYDGAIYYIGRDSRTGETCFNGRMNDFRLYDHCLSKKEIKEISKALAIHYTLDDTSSGGKVFDCSGMRNDGIANSITSGSDSPRYSACSVFNGSSSYIKVNNANIFAQYVHEMTINLWAYHTNWAGATNAHLFSCTESGGFNTEAGNSGYLRFIVHVATVDTQNSYEYRYDSNELKISDLSSGWHMFTFVYTDNGTKTYIDGMPHHTYNYSSPAYGIHFNLNSRLFLGCEANTANPQAPYFNGKESDFRIYYTALSDDDIFRLYSVPISVGRNGSVFAGEYVEVVEE